MAADKIDAVRTLDAEKLEEQEMALLEFARKSTLEPAEITDEEFAELKSVGLDDAEIMEAQFAMAFATAEVKFCDSLGFVPTRI
jgi:alkylhydroperoxidase family enzyme